MIIFCNLQKNDNKNDQFLTFFSEFLERKISLYVSLKILMNFGSYLESKKSMKAIK